MERGDRIIVGITGNIGSGKTLVSKYFEEYGAHYICADEIGQEVLIAIKDELKAAFGESIMTNGVIDRRKLRNTVFSSEKHLLLLNKLSHPLLIKEIIKRIGDIETGIIVIDAALLFDWPEIVDRLDCSILVSAPDIKKEERTVNSDLDHRLFRSILQFQPSEQAMSRLATYVISNDGTIPELKQKTQKIFEEIKNDC
jgi:dephospho-CoA kinase